MPPRVLLGVFTHPGDSVIPHISSTAAVKNHCPSLQSPDLGGRRRPAASAALPGPRPSVGEGVPHQCATSLCRYGARRELCHATNSKQWGGSVCGTAHERRSSKIIGGCHAKGKRSAGAAGCRCSAAGGTAGPFWRRGVALARGSAYTSTVQSVLVK
jgi:hypothetical protein